MVQLSTLSTARPPKYARVLQAHSPLSNWTSLFCQHQSLSNPTKRSHKILNLQLPLRLSLMLLLTLRQLRQPPHLLHLVPLMVYRLQSPNRQMVLRIEVHGHGLHGRSPSLFFGPSRTTWYGLMSQCFLTEPRLESIGKGCGEKRVSCCTSAVPWYDCYASDSSHRCFSPLERLSCCRVCLERQRAKICTKACGSKSSVLLHQRNGTAISAGNT